MAEKTKPLTKAQQQHLITLNSAILRAQQQLNDFVAYLRDEHGAPASDWELYDIQQGFVKTPAKQQS